MSKAFDISRYQVSGSEGAAQPAAVCLPTQAFRINPDPSGRIKDVLITWHGKRCYLVDPDVKSAVIEAGYPVFRANLYEAVRATGQRIVLPITYNPEHSSWMDSALEMLSVGRAYWITRESDYDGQRHIIKRATGTRKEPVWVDDFLALVEEAFGDNIVTEGHPLTRTGRPATRGFDEIDDEFA